VKSGIAHPPDPSGLSNIDSDGGIKAG